MFQISEFFQNKSYALGTELAHDDKKTVIENSEGGVQRRVTENSNLKTGNPSNMASVETFIIFSFRFRQFLIVLTFYTTVWADYLDKFYSSHSASDSLVNGHFWGLK